MEYKLKSKLKTVFLNNTEIRVNLIIFHLQKMFLDFTYFICQNKCSIFNNKKNNNKLNSIQK